VTSQTKGSRFPKIDPSGLRMVSGADRPSKVNLEMMGREVGSDASMKDFLDSLPDILKVAELKELVGKIRGAADKGKPIIWMMGGHVIKCGLGPILIDLMEHGWLTGVAMHGAGIIHDVELALLGHTSEDVGVRLKDGSFGMTKETAEFLNSVASEHQGTGKGLGESVGESLEEVQAPHREVSVIHAAIRRNLPVTVHVSLGTDVVHPHPSMDGAAVGELTMVDFRIFAQEVSQIGGGGVVLNVGSAVIMPEVFLKALSMVRNLGHVVEDFATANFDQIQHYRPHRNVLERPGGRGYWFTGHHEIMVPLLAAGLKTDIFTSVLLGKSK
jgi:hypothetical protein